jgi:hypothetical protein
MMKIPFRIRPSAAGIKLLFGIISVCILSCSGRSYYVVEIENPTYNPNKVFLSFEDISLPGAGNLIAKYRPDTIFKGETDDFKRILLLRNWINSVIPMDWTAGHYPGEGNVDLILDHALQGQGYHCGHFMKVQNAIMNSFGYVTRTLGAGAGVQGTLFTHHGANEIWSNQHNKWFLSDAEFDHHFEKDGIPLSALEVRNEFLKNKAANIINVKGPDRTSFEFDEEIGMTSTEFAGTYTWITWDRSNDMFTAWPDYKTMLIMYDDEYYKTNTWIRGSRPHWIYGSPESLHLVKEADEIYFTPNTIGSRVEIKGNSVRISLMSDTPNLKEYQIRKFEGDKWVNVDAVFETDLKGRRYEFAFRTLNLAGVAGPEHRIIIESK